LKIRRAEAMIMVEERRNSTVRAMDVDEQLPEGH